jgi:FkbM family methyltransferase
LNFAAAQTRIVKGFENRLQHLKRPVKSVLDVGAYRGDFARLSKKLFPGATIKCIEADERQKPYLKEFDTLFCLLGNKNKAVDFYTLPENACTTGSSMYRENTVYYQNPIVIRKQCYKLDDLNLEAFDLIKLDVQGAELDVLKGGKKYLLQTKPSYLLLETAVQEYNQNAPLASELISYLFKQGYNLRDIVDFMYDDNNQLLQVDFLFERNA